MSYNKTTWTSGQKITADLLNHTEDGIDTLNTDLTNLSSTVNTINTDLTNLYTTVNTGLYNLGNNIEQLETRMNSLENKVEYDLILTSSYNDFTSPPSQNFLDFISITKGNLKNFITSLKNNQYPKAILVLTKVQQQDLHSGGIKENNIVYYFPFTYYKQYTWTLMDESISQYQFHLNFTDYFIIKCDENGNIINIDS